MTRIRQVPGAHPLAYAARGLGSVKRPAWTVPLLKRFNPGWIDHEDSGFEIPALFDPDSPLAAIEFPEDFADAMSLLYAWSRGEIHPTQQRLDAEWMRLARYLNAVSYPLPGDWA